MAIFNIFAKVQSEIEDFDRGGIYIIGKPDNGGIELSHNRGKRGGYWFSQRELLESITLACASKFKTGIFDDEGQRKAYLNIVNFYRDVTKMKININVSNYIFEPLSLVFTWIVWVFSRQFKRWAQQNDYDDEIDAFADDLATFGTCVAIKLDKCSERVPIRTIKNTQAAPTLYDAAANGGYVIFENEYHYNVLKKYKDWNVEGLNKWKKYDVIVRFGLVPVGLIKDWESLSSEKIAQYSANESEDLELAMAVIIPQGADSKSKGQRLLYLEKQSEDLWPLDECHMEQRDGRWLGIGEVEKQLEAQLARNLNANLRRRGTLWATKKLFWSTDDNIQNNLIMEVRDGDVLRVGQGKTVGQLNTANQHSSDIDKDDAAWIDASKESSFAFEVATGEALPSGTPFRLGVVLQQAVAQHFTLVRENFSRFLKRCYFNQLVPIFKTEYSDEHEVIVNMGDDDIENFKQQLIDYHTNDRIWDAMLAGRKPDRDKIRTEVTQEVSKSPYAFVKVRSRAYDLIEYEMNLNLTDDISAEISDLTTLYQAMSAKGDPRAERVLALIFAKRGQPLANILGPSPQSPTAPPAAGPGANGAAMAAKALPMPAAEAAAAAA